MGTVSLGLCGASDLDVSALMLLTKQIQISQQMSHGVIMAGTKHFEESCWHNDTLEGLPYDNVLWGYMVYICEEQQVYGAGSYGDDPVFQHLIMMGTFNWTHADMSLYATSQAIRFSTALASRLASRNQKLENEVR